MIIYGADMGDTDGNVNWVRMKETGIQFAMLRAGYGSGSIDLQFRKNAEACESLGIPCGTYWHSYAYTFQMAENEADYFAETIEEFQFSYPICVKYDHSSVCYARSKGVKMTMKDAKEIVKRFCARMEEHGYESVFFLDLKGLQTISAL